MQKTSDGKIVAQLRYASRLLRIAAEQDYLAVILPRIDALGREKCDPNHSITGVKTSRLIMRIGRILRDSKRLLRKCPVGTAAFGCPVERISAGFNAAT
jgi:hypothetical protein